MTTARTKHGPTVVLDPPPAWLSVVPNRALTQRDANAMHRAADKILGALHDHGIYARPTLAQVEAERARRGRRPRLVISTEPLPPRVVLPMGSHVSPIRSEAGVVYGSGESRAEGRRNRARIEAALGEMTSADVQRIGWEIDSETRDAQRAERRAERRAA